MHPDYWRLDASVFPYRTTISKESTSSSVSEDRFGNTGAYIQENSTANAWRRNPDGQHEERFEVWSNA